MEVVPALDLRGGRVVRLLQGDFGRETRYPDDALAIALGYAAAGARRLHVVDLDAARGSGDNRALVERLAAQGVEVGVPPQQGGGGRVPPQQGVEGGVLPGKGGFELQVAGGVRSLERAERWLQSGATRVVMGTLAVREPDRLAEIASALPQRVLAALDVRRGRPAVTGWSSLEEASVHSVLSVWNEVPLAGVIVTSIDRDGTMGGPDLALLGEVVEASRWPVTYSGGIASLEDVQAVAGAGAAAVILGKSLLEGTVNLPAAISLAASRERA